MLPTFLPVCYPSLPFFVLLIINKLYLLNCAEGTGPGVVLCVTQKRPYGLSFFWWPNVRCLCKVSMETIILAG